jgi:hypothetical protein
VNCNPVSTTSTCCFLSQSLTRASCDGPELLNGTGSADANASLFVIAIRVSSICLIALLVNTDYRVECQYLGRTVNNECCYSHRGPVGGQLIGVRELSNDGSPGGSRTSTQNIGLCRSQWEASRFHSRGFGIRLHLLHCCCERWRSERGLQLDAGSFGSLCNLHLASFLPSFTTRLQGSH